MRSGTGGRLADRNHRPSLGIGLTMCEVPQDTSTGQQRLGRPRNTLEEDGEVNESRWVVATKNE
jgi:hypothetical protein